MATREIRRKKEKDIQEKYNDAEKKRSKNPVLWGFSVLILVVIIITFIGIPITGKMGGTSRLIFGTYNKEPIEYVPGNFFAQQREILADQIKDSITDDNYQWQLYQLWRQAYENTVIHTALIQEAENSGIYITDDNVDVTIAKHGPYTQNGVFNEQAYLSTPAAERAATRKLIHASMIQQKVLEDLVLNPKIGSKERDFVKTMASPERSFSIVAFSYSDYPDSEYLLFAKENSELFKRMRLSRITVRSSKKDAEAVLNQARENPSQFEDLARAHSVDGFADLGGDMGIREYQQMKSDFNDTQDLDEVFSMKKGDILGPFETSFGWTIYRCDEESSVPDFDSESLDSVRSYVQRYERGRIEDYLIAQAEDFKREAEDRGLQSAATFARKNIIETEAFPINYGSLFFLKPIATGSSESLLNSVSNSESALTALFSLNPETISSPIILDESVIIAKLKEERMVPEEELSMIDLYYPYIVQQFLEEDTTSQILASPKFQDDFFQVYSRLFLESQEPQAN